MRFFKWCMSAGVLLFGLYPLFCTEQISPYTEQKISELLNPYVIMGLENKTDAALHKISALEAEIETTLPSMAIDLEQERLILQSLCLMERRHYQYDTKTKSPELQAAFKEQFKKNEQWLLAHEGKPANKWLLLFTGDLTSCYMVRSLSATIGYGMHVRRLYERALENNKTFALAYINLGLWRQYAPKIFGGGEEKAFEEYTKAFACATTDSERYIASIYLSQYWFTKNDKETCES